VGKLRADPEARRLHRLTVENPDERSGMMPKDEHLKGVGEEEQRMYEHIVDEAKKDHRYGKRTEEVAARTVLKHHREEQHDKGE